MILAPLAKQRFYDNNNNPLNKGQLFCYIAGTTTKQTTYSDAAGTPNTNPVILNYRGECDLWLDTTKTYKFVLAPANDTDPPTNAFWSVDNIPGGYGGTINYTQIVYPQTAAELAASVTPVNLFYQSGVVDRYGTNTIPGTTDMSTAFANACLCNKVVTFRPGFTYLGTFSVPSTASTYGELFIDYRGAILIGKAGASVVLQLNGGIGNDHQHVLHGSIDMSLMTDSSTTYGFDVALTYDGYYAHLVVTGEGANSFGMSVRTGVYTTLFENCQCFNVKIVGTTMGNAVTSTTFLDCDVQQYYMRFATGITVQGGAIQWSGGSPKNMFDLANVRGVNVFGVDVESNANATYVNAGTNVTNFRSIGNDFVNFTGTMLTGSVDPSVFWDFYDPAGANAFKWYSSNYSVEWKTIAGGLKFTSSLANNQQMQIISGTQSGAGAYSGIQLANSTSAAHDMQVYVGNDDGYLYIADHSGNVRAAFKEDGTRYVPQSVAENANSRTQESAGYYRQNKFNGVNGDSFQEYIRNGVLIGSITQNGTTGVTYNTTSDERVKENIEPLILDDDWFDSLEPVTYNFIGDESKQLRHGFIAQRLYKVVPEAVLVGGDDPNTKPWMIDKTEIIPFLVAEIQRLRKKIK